MVMAEINTQETYTLMFVPLDYIQGVGVHRGSIDLVCTL
jgi:hypothetical protein